jgi:hypothetical protein
VGLGLLLFNIEKKGKTMNPILWTAIGELGVEVVSAIIDKRRRQRKTAKLEQEKRDKERALIKRRTADRIRLAKERYWARRRGEEARRAELDKQLKDLKRPVDENPYTDPE